MKKNQRFKLTDSAIEDYGEQYRDRVFEVVQWFNKYEKASSAGKYTDHGHPGYDEGFHPEKLYEFKDAKTQEEMQFAVYDCEVIPLK